MAHDGNVANDKGLKKTTARESHESCSMFGKGASADREHRNPVLFSFVETYPNNKGSHGDRRTGLGHFLEKGLGGTASA